MTFENSVLHDYKDSEVLEPVRLGDGHMVLAVRVGKIKITT